MSMHPYTGSNAMLESGNVVVPSGGEGKLVVVGFDEEARTYICEGDGGKEVSLSIDDTDADLIARRAVMANSGFKPAAPTQKGLLD